MTGRQIALNLCRRFPNAPALTLAKKAYKEHPSAFASLEGARTAIRLVFGVSGTHGRNARMAVPELRRPPRKAGRSIHVPKGVVELPGWGVVPLSIPSKILLLSDVHVPYHDPGALRLALQYGRKRHADHILLNGDFCDCHFLSKFEKDPERRSFKDERDKAVRILALMRSAFPKAKITWLLGNHEERYQSFMRTKCPEFFDLDEFSFENVFHLQEHGVVLIGQRQPLAAGKLHIIHGHEYSFPISNPVNASRGLFLRAKVHAVCGHFHRSSHHAEKNLEGNVVSCWSTGCLCDLHPKYRPINDWNLGFAFLQIGKDGAFQVENLRIVDHKIWK